MELNHIRRENLGLTSRISELTSTSIEAVNRANDLELTSGTLQSSLEHLRGEISGIRQAEAIERNHLTTNLVKITRNAMVSSFLVTYHYLQAELFTGFGPDFSNPENFYNVCSGFQQALLDNFTVNSRILLGDLPIQRNNLIELNTQF